MVSIKMHTEWNGELSKAYLETSEQVRLLPESKQPELRALLDEVDRIAKSRPPVLSLRRLNEWWTGTHIEASWNLLHQVQLELLATAHLPQMQELFEIVIEHGETLPVKDPARIQLVNFINELKSGSLKDHDIEGGR